MDERGLTLRLSVQEAELLRNALLYAEHDAGSADLTYLRQRLETGIDQKEMPVWSTGRKD